MNTQIGENDAPTRIRVGSHFDAARALAPYGRTGLFREDLSVIPLGSEGRPEVLATGSPGDVYVCHPFLVHAAQENRRGIPRMIAQPGIELPGGYALNPGDAAGCPPVECAILRALENV